MNERQQESLAVLTEIRSIMHKSSRFLSLSGWSGIWAGVTGLAASSIAWLWLDDIRAFRQAYADNIPASADTLVWVNKFVVLAILTFMVALVGAFFFTWRKNNKHGADTFSPAARRMAISMMIPIGAAACFILFFIKNHDFEYIIPATLVFYGLTLINSSKYTFADIRYLGLCEVLIGCLSLFLPEWNLGLWALGFGLMHIVYGVIMWYKYDRKA